MKMVLVVEDDFDTLHPLSELLRLKGYDTVTASDVDRALSLACARRPDLILTDIALPGKNGLQFIAAVRREQAIRETPIIVISGCGPVLLIEASTAGADVCLEKPINLERLWQAFDLLLHTNGADRPERELEHAGGKIASEIDRLVDDLRRSTSKDEREEYLKRLKTRILELQSLRKSCA
ncbi:MAG: response regulator [Blastocatellia bacterium]